MDLSVLTCNTLFNNAANSLDTVIDQYHPDIICLQEALTDEKNIRNIEKFGYKLADYSNSFVKFGQIFGVITFYNRRTISYKDSSLIKLSTNWAEYFFYILRIVLGYNQPKTMLETRFTHRNSKKKITICNVHLYVIASNELRIKHINQALKSINLLRREPLIIVGDFNYFPYRRRGLERVMAKYNLREATANISQTMQFSNKKLPHKYNLIQRLGLQLVRRFFAHQIKTDYSFYRGLELIKTTRIESKASDHFPIISTFKI